MHPQTRSRDIGVSANPDMRSPLARPLRTRLDGCWILEAVRWLIRFFVLVLVGGTCGIAVSAWWWHLLDSRFYDLLGPKPGAPPGDITLLVGLWIGTLMGMTVWGCWVTVTYISRQVRPSPGAGVPPTRT